MTTQSTIQGVVYFYGPRAPRDFDILGNITQLGDICHMEFYWPYNALPTPGTSPGFMAGSGIPALSVIRAAYYEVLASDGSTPSPFAGGTSYAIGLQTVNGTAINNTGLWTALALASINTVGASGVSSGALINTQITPEGFPVVVATGTFTAGIMRMVISFTPPSSAVNI